MRITAVLLNQLANVGPAKARLESAPDRPTRSFAKFILNCGAGGRFAIPQCIETTTLLLPAKKRFTDRIEPMNGAHRNGNAVGIERDIAMATLGLVDGAAGLIIKFQQVALILTGLDLNSADPHFSHVNGLWLLG